MYTHARRRVTITCVRGRLRARGLDLPLGCYGGEPMCFWTGCNCSEGWSTSEKNRREGGSCSSACAEASCSQGSGKAAEAAAESAGAAAPHTPIYISELHCYQLEQHHLRLLIKGPFRHGMTTMHTGTEVAQSSLCVVSSFWNWNRPQNGPQSGGELFIFYRGDGFLLRCLVSLSND